jgi:hypothetical protein
MNLFQSVSQLPFSEYSLTNPLIHFLQERKQGQDSFVSLRQHFLTCVIINGAYLFSLSAPCLLQHGEGCVCAISHFSFFWCEKGCLVSILPFLLAQTKICPPSVHVVLIGHITCNLPAHFLTESVCSFCNHQTVISIRASTSMDQTSNICECRHLCICEDVTTVMKLQIP